MKKILWFCLAAGLGAGLLPAFDITNLKPQGYVSDFAGVLDPASRAALERYSARVEAATGAEMAFVTIPTLDGEPIEDVANTLFRKWGIGKKGQDDGVLVLLATGDRKFRMEVGYGLEPVITDGDAGEVLRSMRPALREGRYGEALEDAAQQIGGRIAQAKRVSLDAPLPTHRHRSESPLGPVYLFLGGLALFWFLGAIMGRGRRAVYGYGSGGIGGFLPGFLIGNLLGRAVDFRRSGGGFGGYDSSDGFGGFGGFGGGDSGGGGASSNW